MIIYLMISLLVLALVTIFVLWAKGQRASQEVQTYQRLLGEREVHIRQLDNTLGAQRAKEVELSEQNASLTTRLELSRQTIEQLQNEHRTLGEELKGEFRSLASSVLKEHSSDLDKRNEEALKPLREDLKRFGEQVQKTYADESRERFSLERIIRELMERSLQVSQDAQQLTKALRGDAKVQGDWGEMILDHILEASGLREGEEYFLQQEYRDEEGNRLRPDVVVKYPNGGFMVIDSKVSLVAYTDFVSAETDEARAEASRRHLQSVQRHIDELSRKSYETLVKGTPDFVLLFIPNEPAYNLAMQTAPNLWLEAYKKRIVLINGTNLIAALRMAQDMWQRDRQIRNVERIIEEAEKLYDKFRVYTDTLLSAEKQVKTAYESVSKAVGQLKDGRGNIISRLEKLSELGVSIKKPISNELRTLCDDE